ncbi:MAG: DNA-directed RNA polymerase subunit beta' [bacterium]|nr:DNA-directed RNA polymerase subunit beta' [bacterium]
MSQRVSNSSGRDLYCQISPVMNVPDLMYVQREPYAEFLQRNVTQANRKNQGLQAVFNEFFPIIDEKERFCLEFLNYSIGDPKYNVSECERCGATYAAPLKVRMKLTINEEGSTKAGSAREQEMYLLDLPLMTEQGTFIINGSERVIVSQLHRSPGLYCQKKEVSNEKELYSARLIPYRGVWLEFEFDANDVLYVSMDRKRKMLATVLLRAFGYVTDEEIIRLFYNCKEKIITNETVADDLVNEILSEDVVDENTGEIIAESKERITPSIAKKILTFKIKSINIIEMSVKDISIINTLAKDHRKSKEEAFVEIYKRLRPSDHFTIDTAETYFKDIIYNPRRYDLSQVGRYKLNQKLGLNYSLDKTTLDKEDIVKTINYLLLAKCNKEDEDDIDHLWNRRVRTVGELLQSQFRIGLAKLERSVKERIAFQEPDTVMPHDLINGRLISSTVNDFFARGQLSQFMDQTNPLAELTHKRRLSALGPGGLTRERAGFEVRDVHPTHYGRICSIETPEGPNIGLIASLATYTRVNKFGLLETPARRVVNGRVTNEVVWLSADPGNKNVVAQANAKIDKKGHFIDDEISVRIKGDFRKVSPKDVNFVDVSPDQIVSVAAGLIPFLEHDDANRALMGSNMQRQAVPLLNPEAPLIGTGMESIVAKWSGSAVAAKRAGIVESVCSDKIIIRPEESKDDFDEYILKKFEKSNQNTCINQRPIVKEGERVSKNDIIAEASATDNKELALGQNLLVAFMPWRGYNFEDAIVISEKLVRDDTCTSIHIEQLEVEARETKLGKEEITRDIPNVSDGELANLDEHGIVRIGTHVKPGDILVGKVTPKSETGLTSEEKLLIAIFGEKASDVLNTSLTVPVGVEGVVTDVRILSRRDKDDIDGLGKKIIEDIEHRIDEEIRKTKDNLIEALGSLIRGEVIAEDMINKNGKVFLSAGQKVRIKDVDNIPVKYLRRLRVKNNNINKKLLALIESFEEELKSLSKERKLEVEKIKKGDELSPGVIKRIMVYIGNKRKISKGDKVSGRHGNKGVIAKILPEEDMPYLSDGTSVEILLNPLGVPSRMNVGQILETHLGWVAKVLGIKIATPVFNGIKEAEIKQLLKKAGLPEDGQVTLYDGMTGESFDNKITVGYIYMMKLSHLVDDKMHARATGPYSLVTQQPLGGKAQFGGQRFGEMEVWALEAYGAAYTLQELLTVKSDDVVGRMRIYESIVKGENTVQSGIPESFNVLLKELQGLGLGAKLVRAKGPRVFSDLAFRKWQPNSSEEFQNGTDTIEAISISLVSPEEIRLWSKGEVRKPETINYRTFRPEKDGLFCERIFGPTKDWECYCGKYKRIRHKGVICDRCGVEVTQSKVRRQRMGHISLASPVAHVWLFKVVPSYMSTLLDLSLKNIEKILYYESYVVLDAGKTSLGKYQLLSDEEYEKYREEFGNGFHAEMGASAIKKMLQEIDLDKLAESLREKEGKTAFKQAKKKINKRLRVVEAFHTSGSRPEWMIMDVIPVIPPDLRPLVPLDGGRFATSDLNDLYRRVINRNNRLKRLLELGAPNIIIRNEKRMLQESVDALFDNGRHGRTVVGHGNRPLKSLSNMLGGKQGRFRQNLLGKRVDYSGRSVIVVDPRLKLHQCGLPKRMALELFEPFVIRKLRERGIINTIKNAKKMLEKAEAEIWDILDDVIKNRYVLLNRAPTLHRLGIQAFQPVLIEGKAIGVHPLVCAAFNADFDGDQMAVHVPLTPEAELEAEFLMLPSRNIFSPASGEAIMVPRQEIVLGCYYLTKEKQSNRKEEKIFSSSDEAIIAYDSKKVKLHSRVKIRINGELIETTVGRILFNEILPNSLQFVNRVFDKDKLGDLIEESFKKEGYHQTVIMLDRIKTLGFEMATKGGISICIDNIVIPAIKSKLLEQGKREASIVEEQYRKGVITDGERYNKVIDVWTHTTDKVSDAMFKEMEKDPFNPVLMMLLSGARGSSQQIRQLAGMRGLMAKPKKKIIGEIGEIIETPIMTNFREGLSMLEYFISTHGARKGLADTALKTAEAGYLTRRLVDVAQDVVVTSEDCRTLNGISVVAIKEGDRTIESLKDRLAGRIALEDIKIPLLDNIIVKAGEEIADEMAEVIEEAGVEKVMIRSVLTCEQEKGICAKCYGRDLTTKKRVRVGEAVGIIAAQSIGEPGTQLTLRTFHIGGTASRIIGASKIVAINDGIVKFHGIRTVVDKNNNVVVINRNGEIAIENAEEKELERCNMPLGSVLKFKDNDVVKRKTVLAEWDPYTLPVISIVSGEVKFIDIIEGLTMKTEVDKITGKKERIITDYRSTGMHTQILIQDKNGEVLNYHSIPSGAYLIVKEGEQVLVGDLLAKTTRERSKTRDITGGLPRIAELFEARRPKNPAIVTEIDGIVDEPVGLKKNMRRITVTADNGDEKEYLIPHGKHLIVYKGDRVKAGDQLTDGSVILDEILRIEGDRRLQEYLLNEVQEVYRLQGVYINDKHIGLIVRQMLRKVSIEDSGDTKLLAGEQVDKVVFKKENERAVAENKKPARAIPVLQGITRASINTESFISAASFQETTRVLTKATVFSKVDRLSGLKENVIIGRLIPAGTGWAHYRNITLTGTELSDKKDTEEAKDKDNSSVEEVKD